MTQENKLMKNKRYDFFFDASKNRNRGKKKQDSVFFKIFKECSLVTTHMRGCIIKIEIFLSKKKRLYIIDASSSNYYF
jgi:hypothetical protein